MFDPVWRVEWDEKFLAFVAVAMRLLFFEIDKRDL
jgi:hypothetical protein